MILDDDFEYENLSSDEKKRRFNLNFGKPCLFIQSRERLNKAREHLKTTKYYENFDKEYQDDILSH